MKMAHHPLGKPWLLLRVDSAGPCKTAAVSAETFKNDSVLRAAGKSADIGRESRTPNAALVKFYMRPRLSLAGVKCLAISCFAVSVWLDKLRMKSTSSSISQHVISSDYVVILERP